ncbi:MAG: hypothetical protein M1320_00225 [Patescibacteria group bacterium]|nr:hypothetical protein [Patescibacteria group bacterium]
MHIHKTKEHIHSLDLQWEANEREQIERDILSLRNDQIGALSKILVDFRDDDILDIVNDIKQNGINSGHLPILLEEAASKEQVRWWVHYFKSSK